jgi:hypothetical protein
MRRLIIRDSCLQSRNWLLEHDLTGSLGVSGRLCEWNCSYGQSGEASVYGLKDSVQTEMSFFNAGLCSWCL